jgi:hypothetical protein
MKTVLAAAVLGLLLGASPLTSFATETDRGPQVAAAVFTLEGDETPPAEAAEEGADQDATGQDAATQDSTDLDEPPSDDAVMQNFTRHRPGACPEGPPCKTE